MPVQSRPRDLVIVSFATLSLGFLAGWWMGRESAAPGPVESPVAGAAPHPVGAEEYLQLGMQALSAGDFPEAEARFRRAVELRPDEAAPHADLAVALMYQQRWDEAQATLERAKERDPRMPEIWFLEGVVHREGRGDAAAARAAWRTFLDMAPPDSPQAATVRGWLAELDGTAPAEAPPASPGGVATPEGGS